MSPGSWSPDGTKIVYYTTVDGNTDVFVVDAAGGPSRRLTFESSIDGVPSWSRGGQFIYFASTRAGVPPDIWRVRAEGGPAIRITYHGGFRAREGADGNIYYVDRPQDGSGRTPKLMRMPVGGGPETEVLKGLGYWWSVADQGVYFVSRESEFDAIDRYNFNDRRVVRLGRLALRAFRTGELSVSPDGRLALVSVGREQADLMLLDRFR